MLSHLVLEHMAMLHQWPDQDLLPGFKNVMERYLAQVEELGLTFISLLSEAFGLPPNALDDFYDSKDLMQHRAKVNPCALSVNQHPLDSLRRLSNIPSCKARQIRG